MVEVVVVEMVMVVSYFEMQLMGSTVLGFVLLLRNQ